jgi:hypothetical protein
MHTSKGLLVSPMQHMLIGPVSMCSMVCMCSSEYDPQTVSNVSAFLRNTLNIWDDSALDILHLKNDDCFLMTSLRSQQILLRTH